jgi:hypothetical protein
MIEVLAMAVANPNVAIAGCRLRFFSRTDNAETHSE